MLMPSTWGELASASWFKMRGGLQCPSLKMHEYKDGAEVSGGHGVLTVNFFQLCCRFENLHNQMLPKHQAIRGG